MWLTSCFACFDSAALPLLNQQKIDLFSQIQTSQTEGSALLLYFPLRSN